MYVKVSCLIAEYRVYVLLGRNVTINSILIQLELNKRNLSNQTKIYTEWALMKILSVSRIKLPLMFVAIYKFDNLRKGLCLLQHRFTYG